MERITRRGALQWLVGGAGLGLLVACGAPPAPSPQAAATVAPPTSAPAPPTVAAAATTPVSATPAAATSTIAQPRNGGTLRYAMVADLSTLDPHVTNSQSYATIWSV